VRRFSLIAVRDLHDLTSGVAFRILSAVLLALAAVLAAGAALLRLAPPGCIADTPGCPTPTMLVGTMLYFATFLPFVVFLWVFAGAILIKEKSTGHLETLLATPVSTKALWLAKTAVIALPGLVIAGVSSALIVISLAGVGLVRPDVAPVSIPAPLLVVCWLGNPLLLSGLGAATTVLSMRASPDVAIVPSFAVGFGLMVAIPAGVAVRILDLASWAFASAYLIAGGGQWLAALALARGLTRERIVLSSREE
jgi:ABC-type transport system involved in multi-copper enzyme maturation permease subunit